MNTEGVLGYSLGHYKLVSQQGMDQHCFQAGEVFEIRVGGQWRAVRMKSGGYKGWFFVTADGQQARLALCMKARLADALHEGHA